MLTVCTIIFILLNSSNEQRLESRFPLDGVDPTVDLFASAAREILKSFYSKITTTVFITIGNETNEIREILSDTIKSERIPLVYVIEESEYVNSDKHRRYFNLFIVDTYESFQRIFVTMNDQSFDYTGFYTILLTEVHQPQLETVTKILQDCWSLYITNVHVLTMTDLEATALLYTYFPYTPKYCEQVEPRLQDFFVNGSFVSADDMFPNKFRNFYKCPLSVSTYNLIPYMVLTEQLNGSYHMDGIDGITFRVISQQLNFTPIVHLASPNVVQQITAPVGGRVNPNKPKLKRSLEMLDDKTVNMSMGAIIYSSERARKYSVSSPYYYGSFVFAVPPGKPFSSLAIVFFPFKYIVWLCILSIFVFTVIVVLVLKLSPYSARAFVIGPRNDSPVFNMLNICFGGTMSNLPTRNFARTILLIWLMMSMVLKTAYQSRLYDYLRTQPHRPPPDHRSEIYSDSSDVILYLTESFYQAFYEGRPELRNRLEIYNGNLTAFENLRSSSFAGVYLSTSAAISHYNMKNFRKGHILMTQDKVLFLPYAIFFRKHSSLSHAITWQIDKYKSNGLISVWSDNLTHKKLMKQYLRSDQIQMRAPKVIGMHQIRGVFTLCMLMYLIGGFVLMLELLTIKYVFIRKLMDFCTFKQNNRRIR